MSLVNITNVIVLDNPTTFTSPFQFEITFECLQDLHDDLEWKVIYVGSSESADYDQVLEEVLVGPVTMGCHQFLLEAPCPNPDSISKECLLGVTVILITCAYQNQEFVRIGYYVNNEIKDDGIEQTMTTMTTSSFFGQEAAEKQLTQQQQFHTHDNGERDLGQDGSFLMDDDDDDDDDESMDAPLPSSDATILDVSTLDLSRIIRTTLADKPRVTRFTIAWDPPLVATSAMEDFEDDAATANITTTHTNPDMFTSPHPSSVINYSDESFFVKQQDEYKVARRIVSPTEDMEYY